jgi:hypothetical protein
MRQETIANMQMRASNLSNDTTMKDIHNLIDAILDVYRDDLFERQRTGVITGSALNTALNNLLTERNTLVGLIT